MRWIGFFLLWTVALFSEPIKNPKICLNMIVKNETKVICRCLETVKPLIDYWVIVDTGSKDGTQQMIRDYLKDIPGELHERPWVHFAHNRNEALALAKTKGDYILMIDADDQLFYDSGFIKPKMLDQDGYLMHIHYGGMRYDRIQLIRSSFPWKWEGVVHEVLFSDKLYSTGTLEGVTMQIIGGGDRSRDKARFLKDAELLEEALKANPQHTRNTFYLAQSYRDAGLPEKSIAAYEKRVSLGGWDQEVFWSLYQIATLKEQIGAPFEEVTKAYEKAFLYRPLRAEPLCQLATYYRKQGNYLLGYAIAKMGMSISPPDDPLFVELWMYQYGLLLEGSICAYYLDKYKEALDWSNQLLADRDLPPHVVDCVRGNLRCILGKTEEKTLLKNL